VWPGRVAARREARAGGGGLRPGECDQRGVEIELINRPNERPLGAGEGASGPAVAAVANAFANATGKRVRDLPLNPARVKAAIG